MAFTVYPVPGKKRAFFSWQWIGWVLSALAIDHLAVEFQPPNWQFAGIPEGDGDRVEGPCAGDQGNRARPAGIRPWS